MVISSSISWPSFLRKQPEKSTSWACRASMHPATHPPMPNHSRPQGENAGRLPVELSRRESIHPPPQSSVRTACGSGRVGLRSDVTYIKHFHPLLHRIVDLREKR